MGVMQQLTELSADPHVTVGFLGDFSSGKSTLINELVGSQSLMPVRIEPCTAHAGHIVAVADVNEPRFFRLNPDTSLDRVERGSFEDMVLGKSPGRPVAHVPPNAAIQLGMVFADTAGLNAIIDNHDRSTLVEAAFFDCAVICIDLQKGGLSQSVKDFLRLPEIRHLRHRTVFALTHADSKSPAAAEKVRSKVARAISALVQCPTTEAEERVVLASAGPNAEARRNVEELASALDRHVLQRRAAILGERRLRAGARMVQSTIVLLETHRDALKESNTEFEERRVAVKAELREIPAQATRHRRKLDGFERSVREALLLTCQGHLGSIAAASADEEVRARAGALAEALNDTLTRELSEFDQDFQVGARDRGSAHDAIADTMLRINKRAKTVEHVATAVLVAAIAPQVTLTGNLAEGGLGLLATHLANAGAEASQSTPVTDAENGTDGSLSQSDESKSGADNESPSSIVKEQAAKSKPTFKAKAKIAGLAFLKRMNDLNVINHVGDAIALRVKESTAEEMGMEESVRLATLAHAMMKKHYRVTHFEPIEAAVRAADAQLQEIESERRHDVASRQAKLCLLTADLEVLRKFVDDSAS